MNYARIAALAAIAISLWLAIPLAPDFDYRPVESGAITVTGRDVAKPAEQKETHRLEPKLEAPITNRPAPAIIEQSRPIPVDSELPVLYPELAQITRLARYSADTAFVELLPMLSSDDPVIRLAVIESLGDMTIQAVVPVLSTALGDPQPQLRIAVLEALASQQDKSVVGSVEALLYDRNPEVRVAAIEALSDLEAGYSVHALAGLLSDQDLSIRQHAISALEEIGGEDAMRYLLQARYDPDTDIRARIDAILAEQKINPAY